MSPLEDAIAEIVVRRKRTPVERALLVGISGIDGSGKTWLTDKLARALEDRELKVAAINADGWLNLPEVRFDQENPAEHFYRHGLRLDEMFAQLVVPLRDTRRIDLLAKHVEETATRAVPRRYKVQDVDVALVEGIFLFRPPYRNELDLRIWIECSFETACQRAVARAQEGLGKAETIFAYDRIYFPAQQLHFQRDNPCAAADLIVKNL